MGPSPIHEIFELPPDPRVMTIELVIKILFISAHDNVTDKEENKVLFNFQNTENIANCKEKTKNQAIFITTQHH